MSADIERLMFWIQFCLGAAALGATAVPVVYAFSKWNHSKLGRLFMLQSVAFAAAIDLTLLFHFWQPDDIMVTFWLNAIVLTLIAAATLGLAWKIIKNNYRKKKGQALMTDTATPRTHPLLSNETYDKLKFLTVIVLPAFAAFYLAIGGLWDLPSPEKVVGSVTAVNAFFGAVLLLSSKAYNNSDEKYDGVINVYEDRDGFKTASMELKKYEDPADVVAQDEVLFKVTPLPPAVDQEQQYDVS